MPLSPHVLSSRADLEEVSRRRATGFYYGEHWMICRLLGEYRPLVDTRDFIPGPRLVVDGFWEAWMTLALARYIQPGFHCVDVGANYGYYTLLMTAACQRGVRVLACEPNSLLAEASLPANVALNGCRKQVEVCPKAISSIDDQEASFVLHNGDFATSSLERWPIRIALRRFRCQ